MDGSATISTLESLAGIASEFTSKVKDRKLTVGVIGLGYVGLPLCQALVRCGLSVIGFDANPARICVLENGRSPFKHITDAAVEEMANSGRFIGVADFDRLGEPDAILICVPTPLNDHGDPDLTYVARSAQAVGRCLRRGQLVVLESTTYPGTCEEIIIPALEQSGLKAGQDFAVAYSPEREDPGNAHFETMTIPKVVGANSEEERMMAAVLYRAVVDDVVEVRDLRTAEAIKLTENVFRWVNIGLVNELKTVFESMHIDVNEVVEAAATKPFGFMPFYPGPGVGGHCIPVDPYYLSWKARGFGVSARFIELAGEINHAMPAYVVSRLAEALNDRFAKPLAGSRILVLGLAYKANIDDARESPALPIMELLQRRGCQVAYHDPYILTTDHLKDHPAHRGLSSTPITSESLAQFDAAIIVTAHSCVELEGIVRTLPLVVDCRNATREMRAASNIIRA